MAVVNDRPVGAGFIPTSQSPFLNESAVEDVEGGHQSSGSPPQLLSSQPPEIVKKSDKPRPHVCGQCLRAFARLEHLKRHERSHTKEKPFECPECQRCFARRDLLLRHQQKLHLAPDTLRPRAARRESISTSTATPNRVRKNSTANGGGGRGSISTTIAGVRPRANTIGHLDFANLGLLDLPNSITNSTSISHRSSVDGVYQIAQNSRQSQNMTPQSLPNQPTLLHALPRLNTQNAHNNLLHAIQTAPPYSHTDSYVEDSLLSSLHQTISNSTVDPSHLHNFDTSSMLQSHAYDNHINMSAQNGTNGVDYDWYDLSIPPNDHDFAIDDPSPPSVNTLQESVYEQLGMENWQIVNPSSHYHEDQPNSSHLSHLDQYRHAMTDGIDYHDETDVAVVPLDWDPSLEQLITPLPDHHSHSNSNSHEDLFSNNADDTHFGSLNRNSIPAHYTSFDRQDTLYDGGIKTRPYSLSAISTFDTI